MDWNEATTTPPPTPQPQPENPQPPAAPDVPPARKVRQRAFADAKREEKFFEAIELFNGDITKASKAVGICRDTVYDEKKRNPVFAARIEIAAVLFELNCLRTMRAAVNGELETRTGKKEWRAAAWVLERRFWQTYARRDPNAVTPEMLFAVATGISGDLLEFVPVEQRKAAAEKIQARLEELSKAIKKSSESEDELLDGR